MEKEENQNNLFRKKNVIEFSIFLKSPELNFKSSNALKDELMDEIINILLLIIIFVFDPLAISLVISANFAFDIAYPKKEENIYGEKEEPKEDSRIFPEDYDEDRMNVIGQNGNDGEHYEQDIEVVDNGKASGDFKDFDKNYAKYMVIEKDGSRTFLNSKPTFVTTPNNIQVTLPDGRRGKINRGDDSRIIYM